jgi:hypothetical protein
VSGAQRPGCVEDPPSDDGDQNDKQRSCYWRREASQSLVFQVNDCKSLTRGKGLAIASIGGSVSLPCVLTGLDFGAVAQSYEHALDL